MSKRTPTNNNSVIYLALLCLLYFLFTSNFLIQQSSSNTKLENSELIYIETTEDGTTTVSGFTNSDELNKLKTKHGLKDNLKSGDKLVITDHGVEVETIGGRKKIALGIPIEINSASVEDLTAIPGIGTELAARIISYRNSHGNIDSMDELDNIDGIGKKKLANIKNAANLD